MFDNLSDYNGIDILKSFAKEITKPCTIIIPKDIASKVTSEVYIVVSEDDFNYFVDLTDKPEYLANKDIVFCVCRKKDFTTPQEAYIYDI